MLAGFIAAIAGLADAVGWRRSVLGTVAIVAITATIECIGAKTGVPFGAHGYGTQLGPLFLGLIPYSIPLSWFLMLYASLGIALRARVGHVLTLLLAAVGLFAWDLLMEPAMSAAFPFWFWRDSGVWYGMPLANWLAWLVIGPAIGAVLWRVAGVDLRRTGTDRLPQVIYAITGLMPLGMAFRFGQTMALLVGGSAMILYALGPEVWLRLSARRLGPVQGVAPP